MMGAAMEASPDNFAMRRAAGEARAPSNSRCLCWVMGKGSVFTSQAHSRIEIVGAVDFMEDVWPRIFGVLLCWLSVKIELFIIWFAVHRRPGFADGLAGGVSQLVD
jgi:hypothetical protein